MERARRRAVTWWGVVIVALACVVLAVVLWARGGSGRSEDGSPAIRAPGPTPRDGEPRLAGRGRFASPQPQATHDEPPPEVYTTPDPWWTPDAPRAGPFPVRVRVVHPFGTVPPEPYETPHPWIGIWQLEPHEEEEGAAEGKTSRGRVAIDGIVALSASDVEAWRRATLEIFIDAYPCRWLEVERPADPVPEVIEVQAPMEDDAKRVRYAGTVCDASGAPVAGVGVFLEQGFGEVGTRTSPDGTFRLDLVPFAADDPDVPARLAIVAPGFAPLGLPVDRAGQEDLDVVLRPEEHDGALDLRLLAPDGTPAAGARALVRPEGVPLVGAYGLPTVDDDPDQDERQRMRRRLARLVGGQALENQGYNIGEEAILLDLVADAQGRIHVPALAPGLYHLRAVLPAKAAIFADRWADSGELRTSAGVDASFQVEPPPARTSVTVTLPAGRAIVGRVVMDVNPAWHCGEDWHRHFVRVPGWPWQGVNVQSGRSTWAGTETRYTGRFRLEGMPAGALTLGVWTVYHGEVVVPVPAGEPGGVTDVGDVAVPDVRVIHGRLVKAGGGEPGPPQRYDDYAGRYVRFLDGGEELSAGWDSTGRFDVPLRRPPGPGAVLVVGPLAPGGATTEVRWPFDLGTLLEPLVVPLPAAPAGSEDDPERDQRR